MALESYSRFIHQRLDLLAATGLKLEGLSYLIISYDTEHLTSLSDLHAQHSGNGALSSVLKVQNMKDRVWKTLQQGDDVTQDCRIESVRWNMRRQTSNTWNIPIEHRIRV